MHNAGAATADCTRLRVMLPQRKAIVFLIALAASVALLNAIRVFTIVRYLPHMTETLPPEYDTKLKMTFTGTTYD